MTQEDKQLLLKDLCTRLPYGVKVTTTNPAVKIGVISGIFIKNKISVETKDADIVFDCTEVKPYLRPMSSMTKEEEDEFVSFTDTMFRFGEDDRLCVFPLDAISWLNKKMFDYRGLIEKGLAIEVTKENNPYKN